MTPERWREIEDLYNAARDRGPEVLANADSDLRREVQALLAQNSSGEILDRQAFDLPANSTQTLLMAGRQLGPYKLEALLGQGGMGQVFRAIDTRLGRAVAVKVSQERFTDRFEREARAIAALNHPNICTLHDVGPNYLVMELVEGETLAALLKRGKLSFDQTIQYGAQIASALSAAHAKGIVHRDLKPANVMVTPHGVKVLDFGLAKSAHDETLTVANAVMGTPAYMAPEQMEGQVADARADLFALGLVLYEMAKGKLPFARVSLGQMLAGGAPVSIDPPCTAGSKLSSRLNLLILRLLERDPDRRPADAASVRQELLDLSGSGAQRSRVKPVLAAAVAAVLLLAAAALLWFYRSNGTARPWPEVSRVSLIATYAGVGAMPAVSTDGAWVAFSWQGEQGTHRDIYVTRSDGFEQPRRLTHDSSEDTLDNFPAWSPDGRQIAFMRRRGATDGELMVIPAAGGEERKLREVRFVTLPAAGWLAWAPDGQHLVFASTSLESGRSTLFWLRLADGDVQTLISPPDGVMGDASPALSPDGRWLAYLRWSSPEISTLLVQKLEADGKPSGAPIKVPSAALNVASPAWADNHRLIFLSGQQIMEWEAGAAPRQIYLSGSQLMGLAFAGRDAKGTPRLVTAGHAAPNDRIWALPLRGPGLAGGPPVLFSRLGNKSRNPDFSPDGKRLAFASDRTGHPEIWTAGANGDGLRQLTSLELKSAGVPRWSPDGRHVAFFARTDTEPQIYVIDAAGTTAGTTNDRTLPRQVTNEVPGCNIPTWSRDGKFLYCSRKIAGETRLYRVPFANGASQTEMQWLFEGKEAKEIPDGRVLYIKNDRPGLFARSLAGDLARNPEETLVNDIQGPLAYFAPVIEGVYYTGQNLFGGHKAIRFYEYARRQTVDVAPESVTGNVGSLAVSPDGLHLLYHQGLKSEVELTLLQF